MQTTASQRGLLYGFRKQTFAAISGYNGTGLSVFLNAFLLEKPNLAHLLNFRGIAHYHGSVQCSL